MISASLLLAAEPTLRVESAQVRYGHLVAVREVSFEVRKGEVVVLLGANGAGKSSLLKAIIGLEPLAEGSITLEDEPLAGLSVHRRAGKGIGYLPEGRGVFPNMTVEENILTGVTRAALAEGPSTPPTASSRC